MGTDLESNSAIESAKHTNLTSIPSLFRAQVASVISAFAIIVFISHFVHIGWQGLIGDLIAAWVQYVRPAAEFVLDITVVAFCRWAFGWHITIPTRLTDYLSVGATWCFSIIRADSLGEKLSRRFIGFFSKGLASVFSAVGAFLFAVVLWPFYILFALFNILTDFLFYHRYEKRHADEVKANVGGLRTQLLAWRQRSARDLRVYLISLSPLFYFGLLALANYLLSTHRI